MLIERRKNVGLPFKRKWPKQINGLVPTKKPKKIILLNSGNRPPIYWGPSNLIRHDRYDTLRNRVRSILKPRGQLDIVDFLTDGVKLFVKLYLMRTDRKGATQYFEIRNKQIIASINFIEKESNKNVLSHA